MNRQNTTQDPNFTCDNCQADISPECNAANSDGWMDDTRSAYKSISDMFIKEGFNRSKMQEMYKVAEGDTKRALALLLGIHYVVNY